MVIVDSKNEVYGNNNIQGRSRDDVKISGRSSAMVDRFKYIGSVIIRIKTCDVVNSRIMSGNKYNNIEVRAYQELTIIFRRRSTSRKN